MFEESGVINLTASCAEQEIRARLLAEGVRLPEEVTAAKLYRGAVQWMQSRIRPLVREGKKASLYCISAEYMPGRLFRYMAEALGLREQLCRAFRSFGYRFSEVAEHEKEILVGNGSPGRCAWGLLEGITEKGKNSVGYGLCYEEGWFRQKLINGEQIEFPEAWFFDNPLLVAHPEDAVEVTFGGNVTEHFTPTHMRVSYENEERISAVPYDLYLPSSEGESFATLRLWRATAKKAPRGASQEEYLRTREKAAAVRRLTARLYPADNNDEGKTLRLMQSYFLVSAALKDLFRRTTIEKIERNALQLNDLTAILCVPELMRILMDECVYSWEDAWDSVKRKCTGIVYASDSDESAFVQIDLMKTILPRIYAIICEFDRRFPEWRVLEQGGFYGGRLLRGFLKAKEEKGIFAFQLAGVNHKKWINLYTPELGAWLDRQIGREWQKDPELLVSLMRSSKAFFQVEELLQYKSDRKAAFSRWLAARQERAPKKEFLWDVLPTTITQRHRSFLVLLRVLWLYNRLEAGERVSCPVSFIIAGKASPKDRIGKEILRLAWHLGQELAGNRRVSEMLELVVAEEFGAGMAEVLLPAVEIGEQVSSAGSGSLASFGREILALGGVLLGSRTEECERLACAAEGAVTTFGRTMEEADLCWREGYVSGAYLKSQPDLAAVLARLGGKINGERFSLLYDYLTLGGARVADPYLCLAEFASYVSAATVLEGEYTDRALWGEKMIRAIAGSAAASSDRYFAQLELI